jgi:hypothetical protein
MAPRQKVVRFVVRRERLPRPGVLGPEPRGRKYSRVSLGAIEFNCRSV